MPDFDKDLKPELLNITKSAPTLDNPVVEVTPYQQSVTAVNQSPKSALDAFFGGGPKITDMAPTVSVNELNANKRYGIYNPETVDLEDQKSNAQSAAVQAASGILKGTNLAATTVLGSFAMLGGSVQSLFTGRLADVWDNAGMRALDEWNNKVDQEYLPNYYTNAEKNANWYSSDNWLTTNFLFDKLIKNTGFAVGAMASGSIATSALKGAGAAIGAFAESAALANEAKQGMTWYSGLLKNMSRAFSAGKNMEVAAALEKGISTVAELDAATSEIANIARQASRFANINDKGRRIATALYSSAGEASFEALQTSKEYRTNLIEEYKSTHGGEEPRGADLEKINNTAESVGKMSFFGNIALLGATEYVQLPKLLGSTYAADRRAANSLMGEVSEIGMREGKYAATEAATKFGKLYDKATGIGKYAFDWKEGLQENLQYALQVGTQNYYNKAYHGQDANMLVDGMLYGLYGKNEEGEGVGSFVSKEGMEGTLLGAITGGGMQAYSNFQGNKARTANTERFLNDLNNGPTFKAAFIDRMNSVNRGVQLQQQEEQAIIQNDKLEAKDLKADQLHNYLSTRIKYGRFDMVMDDIKSLREEGSTEAGLNALKEQGYANMNDDIQTYKDRLTKFEQVAANTNDIYKALDLRYSGNKAYSSDVIDKLAYASAKISNYDLRIPSVNQILSEAGIPTFEVLDGIINEGKPNKKATTEALAQIDKMRVTDDVKDELKTALSDIIEMSLRRNLFIDEYNKIKEDPEKYQEPKDLGPYSDTVKVRQNRAEEDQAPGRKTVSKELELGKEYSLAEPLRREGSTLALAPKIKVLSKTLGGQYEVELPNGQVKFLTPMEFKEYNIIDSSNDSEELSAILDKSIDTVLKRAQYKDLQGVPAENKLEWINSLNNENLIDDIQKLFNTRSTKFMQEIAKSQYKREQLLKKQGELEQDQSDLEAGSGDFATGTEPDESRDPEKKRKPADKLFTAITLPSAKSKDVAEKDLPVFVRTYNTFINNVRTLANRGNMRAILVTANDLNKYGLTGLAEIAYEKKPGQSFTDEELAKLKSPTHGFVASVFVEQDGANLYYVDVNGNRIGSIKDGADVSKVVFATMPTIDLTWSDGETPRYRVEEKDEAVRFQKGWEDYRNTLFNNPYDGQGPVTAFTFGVSNGFPVFTPGKIQKNTVGDVLGLDNNTLAQPGLVQISTLGYITHQDGQNYKFDKGRTVLSFSDVLQHLQNSKFTSKQAKTIYEVLKAFSTTVKSDLEAKRKVQLKNRYTQYLQNVLFWKKSDNPTNNQIFLDEATGKIHIGQNKYDLIDIEKLENEIISDLQQVYFSANNNTLSNTGQKFYEQYFEAGELKEREWKNYQLFLLASKNPDNSDRETPLTLNITPPSESVPYAFTQKYAFLSVPLTLPTQVAPPVVSAPIIPVAPTTALTIASPAKDIVEARITQMIDAKVIAGQYPAEVGFQGVLETSEGPVKFTLTQEGVSIDAEETIEKFAANEAKVEQMRKDMKLSAPVSIQQAAENPPVPTTPTAAVTPSGAQPVLVPVQPITAPTLKGRKNSFTGHRKVGASTRGARMTEKDMEFFKAWAKKNLPNMPYEYLANMIQVTGGGEAWGRMVNGVVQVVEGGLVGTEFHEASEYVWKGFLSPEEQQALYNEFRSQKGTFVDRESGKTYAYNDPAVTDLMVKERIMDNFADFMIDKTTAKTLSEKIAKFFQAILDFVKSIGKNKSLQQRLFNDINQGRFADKVFPESKKDDVIEYSRVAGLDSQLVYEYVQDIKASFYQGMFATNESLFDMSEKNANAIFDQIIEDYKESGIELSDGQFKDLINITKDSLRSDNFDFTEEGDFSINAEGVTSRNYAADAFTVDFKKSAPYAVKIISSSLIKTDGRPLLSPTDDVNWDYSSNLGGMQLLSYSKVYVTLSNKLANTRDVNDFIAKLYDLAVSNSDYVQLFQRLGGSMDTRTIDLANLNADGMRLFASFMQTYTKQSPEILVQYLRDGNRYTAPANLSKVSQIVENDWISDILMSAGKSDSIVMYDKSKKYYTLKPNANTEVGTTEDQLAFLKALGVDFDQTSYDKLSKDKKIKFGKAVQQVKTDVTEDKVLQLKKQKGQVKRTIGTGLITLAELYASVNSVNYSSVLYNAEGKQQQLFTDSNAPSVFEYYFNSAKTIDELLNSMPQLRDVFAKGSQVLKKGGVFFDEEGKRTGAKLTVKTLNGEINQDADKGEAVSGFNIGTRFVTEINQNLNGNYYILIPADGSTEWMMNMGNVLDYQDFTTGRWEDKVIDIFSGYFVDDIKLARDSANRTKLNNMKGKEKQLRFFEGFLSQPNSNNSSKYTALLNEANALVKQESATDEDIAAFVKDNSEIVRQAIVEYITNVSNKTIADLTVTRDIVQLEDRYKMSGLDNNFVNKDGVKLNKESLSKDQLENVINYTTANYVINNIEYFKVLFGDPLQFQVKTKKGKVILDVTKRIKSFLSPRRTTINFDQLNNVYNKVRNTVGGIQLQPGDVGYHEYKNFARTFTASDILIAGKFYGAKGIEDTNEADAASWLNPGTYREIKDKNAQWTPEAEAFHQWQMAYARQKMSAKKDYKYENSALEAHDAELIQKPCPEYVIDVLKPIVSGSKFNKNYIDLVLDKYSQLPLYYQAIEGTNLEKLFVKMYKENYDYVVVESGRKVGAEGLHPLYKPNGEFNDEALTSSVDIPWSAYGIQVENSYNKPKGQKLGSQGTKIATADMYENGVPVSKEAEEAVKNHTEALKAMYINGFENLLHELGITDTGNSFVISDKSPVAATLRKEMLKQEMSNEALASLTINNDTKDFEVPFEASTNYVKIKRIIYSMVEKRISAPTVNGNSSVQVPVTMWESSDKGRSLVQKVGKTWQPITREKFDSLSEDEKGDVMFTDDTLKFYQDAEGLRYCEVMIPFPNHLKGLFDKMFPEKDEKVKMEKILKYLNTNAEEALFGIGFRIPTQALNSMERFKIAGFLPSFMGNSVIVPSEITTKAGSDFDIDKLNMYMKSMYMGSDGKIQVYKLQGTEEETKEYYGQVFDRMIQNEQDSLINRLLQDDEFVDINLEKSLSDKLNKLEEKKATRDDFVRAAYRKALENNYYSSIDRLLGMEENFDRLTAVNTNKNLLEFADTMDELRGEDESNIVNRVLDRNYMTGQRHAFLMAKKWVGIVALHITGHSNGQKAGLFVDSPDFKLTLPHNKVGNYVSLSGLYDSTGKQYISDNLSEYINAIVDVAKDPYILKLIYSGQIVDLTMFLARAGVTPQNAALFIGQPIIRDFVETSDNSKKSLNSMISNSNMIKAQIAKFSTTAVAKQSVGDVYDVKQLANNIKKYAESKSLSDKANAEQQLILKEFVSAMKAANGLSEITQSTNYDTTNFRSAEELSRKKLKVAMQGKSDSYSIIPVSSTRAVLDNTHLGTLESVLIDATSALGSLFKFNTLEFREFLDSIINRYGANKYLSKDKYNKISEQLSASLLDYIIQTNKNMFVEQLTTGPNSVVAKFEKAKKDNPNLQILKDLKVVPGRSKNAPATIKLANSKLDAADENMYADMLRGLRDNESTRDLYNDLVKLSIVQGTYRTPASIKSIIPIEDYAGIVTDLVKNATVDDSVKNFRTNAMFQRNNFRDANVSPQINLKAVPLETEMSIDPITGDVLNKYVFPSQLFTETGKALIAVGTRSIGSGSDLIIVPRVIEVNNDKVDYQTGLSITPRDFAAASKSDDNAYSYVYGYQLVRYPDTGNPMSIQTGASMISYVYKLVNLYGDGRYTTEYPAVPLPSKLENGTVKITREFTDEEVYDMLVGKVQPGEISTEAVTETAATEETFAEQPVEQEKINEDLSENVTNLEENIESIEGQEKSIKLIDGKVYKASEISIDLLEQLGYKDPSVIGNILKEINGC